MADFVFDKFKEFLGGAVAVTNFETILWGGSSSSTVQAALVVGDMAAVTNIEQSTTVTAAFSDVTLSEYSGTNYVRKAVTGKTVAVASPVITFNGNPASAWASLGAAGANCDGMLVLWTPSGTSGDGQNIPLFYFDFKNATPASLAFNGNGGNVTITFSNGMVTLT